MSGTIGPITAVSMLGAVDTVIVATIRCEGCGKPHITRVSSTTLDPKSIIGILSMAIIDIIDEHDVIPDGNEIDGTNDHERKHGRGEIRGMDTG